MNEYTYIDSDKALIDYRKGLKDNGITSVALDIEGEFNLHVYGERFCLLQLYDGQQEVAVDPLAVSRDLLKSILEDRDLLKITYDCASDRVLLAKSHGIVMNSILDLRPAVEILDFEKQDLASVLDAALGIQEPGSKKRFQQYNWTRRPIESDAIAYAMQDVRYLFALKDTLLDKLVQRGQLEAYILENLKRQDRIPDVDRKPGVFRSGRHKRLNRAQKQDFQRIHDIRDRYARELDLPPDTVLANKDLFALVTGEIEINDVRGNRRVPPEKLEELKREVATARSGH
jgi:ribonuclease D